MEEECNIVRRLFFEMYPIGFESVCGFTEEGKSIHVFHNLQRSRDTYVYLDEKKMILRPWFPPKGY